MPRRFAPSVPAPITAGLFLKCQIKSRLEQMTKGAALLEVASPREPQADVASAAGLRLHLRKGSLMV